MTFGQEHPEHSAKEDERATVSIVVPFGGGDAELLTKQLMAVDRSARLAFDSELAECHIVLSVNAPGQLEPTQVRVKQLGLDTPLRTIDSSQVRGPSYARNRGADASRGELLLFCDADDIVSDVWVSEMSRALRSVDIVSGGLDLVSLNPGADPRDTGRVHVTGRPWGWLGFAPCSTLGVRRQAFDATGGFDESLSIGEDVDFCWRAQYGGATIGTAPLAVVAYRWRDTLRQHFLQTYAWGKGDAFLMKVHRERGLRPEHLAGMRRVLRAVVYVAAVPVFYRRRWNAVGAFGKELGRTVGSLRWRVWAL